MSDVRLFYICCQLFRVNFVGALDSRNYRNILNHNPIYNLKYSKLSQ